MTAATAGRRSTPTRIRRQKGSARLALSPPAARWEGGLGEYVLDWDDVRAAADPHATAVDFARSAFQQACAACSWDPALAATASGTPPPVR